MTWLLKLIAGLSVLAGALDQEITNGASKWGVLPSPSLSAFIDGGPLVDGSPWGDARPSSSAPNTGVLRKHSFSVTRDTKSPDGYNKSLILINDQFPGPLIEANWGDTFQIEVKTPWYDGVPGVTQCPVAPGKSFTYTFQADQYGTSWYHSHYSGQYGDGLFGPIVVYGPLHPDATHDFDLGPVMLHDYTHENSFSVLKHAFTPVPAGPIFFNIDNNLINGKGAFDCDSVNGTSCTPNAGFSKFNFTTGKVHRLRLINAGTASNQRFSIDGHTMTVIA